MNRRESREQAFCLLFEKTFQDVSLQELVESAEMARDIVISDFAREVFLGVEEHGGEIDGIIEAHIIGWKKNRLSKVAVSLLRLAVFELCYQPEIPASVSINEAVELAKKFGGSEDAPFINGVLGAVVKTREQRDE
jgi:N utilization substance protein B